MATVASFVFGCFVGKFISVGGEKDGDGMQTKRSDFGIDKRV